METRRGPYVPLELEHSAMVSHQIQMLGIKLGDLCKSSASSRLTAEPSLQPYEILNEEKGNKVKEINKIKDEFVRERGLAGKIASGKMSLASSLMTPSSAPGTHKAEERATPTAHPLTSTHVPGHTHTLLLKQETLKRKSTPHIMDF